MSEIQTTNTQPSKKPAIVLSIAFILGVGLITFAIVNIIAKINLDLPNFSKPAPQPSVYLVTDIVDGDTIKIQYQGEIQTVRLLGIDTPETRHPFQATECFGHEAMSEMSELIENKHIRAEFDTTQGTHDRYNRLLLYVWRASDNLFLNKHMIKEGFAHEYTYQTPYKYQAEFKIAETYARQNTKGLWGETCK